MLILNCVYGLQFKLASNEAPNRINHSLNEADEVLQKIQKIEKSEEKLQSEILDHLAKVDESVDQLKRLQSQIRVYGKYIKYLKWIMNTDDIRYRLSICTLILISIKEKQFQFISMTAPVFKLLW